MLVLEMLKKLTEIAEKHGYYFAAHTPTSYVFSFKHAEKGRINVYYSNAALLSDTPRFTVQTAIVHPTKGRTQLNRRDVSFVQLERIFGNPLWHTGKGYYKRAA